MRKILILALGVLLFTNCSSSDDVQNNPNLPDYSFNTGTLINTNLPQFNSLKFPGNFITLDDPYGINGIVLYYLGGNSYTAFELSDPNHVLTDCSRLTVNGIIASCNCDDGNAYNIVNGYPEDGTNGGYALKPYFVEVSGSIIRVYNN